VPLNSQMQCLHSKIEEERIERTEAGTKVAEILCTGFGHEGERWKLLDVASVCVGIIRFGQVGKLPIGPVVVAAINDDAAKTGSVAVNVFGGRVGNDVCPELKWIAEAWRCQRVVYDEWNIVATCERGKLVEVENTKTGVPMVSARISLVFGWKAFWSSFSGDSGSMNVVVMP